VQRRVPEPAGDFTLHVSLAYSDTDGPPEPYAAALAAAGPRSATVELGAIQVISLGRDTHLYRWETLATVPIGIGQYVEFALDLSVVIKHAKRSRLR